MMSVDPACGRQARRESPDRRGVSVNEEPVSPGRVSCGAGRGGRALGQLSVHRQGPSRVPLVQFLRRATTGERAAGVVQEDVRTVEVLQGRAHRSLCGVVFARSNGQCLAVPAQADRPEDVIPGPRPAYAPSSAEPLSLRQAIGDAFCRCPGRRRRPRDVVSAAPPDVGAQQLPSRQPRAAAHRAQFRTSSCVMPVVSWLGNENKSMAGVGRGAGRPLTRLGARQGLAVAPQAGNYEEVSTAADVRYKVRAGAV